MYFAVPNVGYNNMKINIAKVRITRNAFEVSEHLPTSTNVIFQGEGQVSSVKVTDNNDGTVNTVSDIKPLILEVKVQKVNKYTSVYKDELKKKSRSQAHRNLLYKLWQEKGEKETFEGFYNNYYDQLDQNIQTKIEKEIMGI